MKKVTFVFVFMLVFLVFTGCNNTFDKANNVNDLFDESQNKDIFLPYDPISGSFVEAEKQETPFPDYPVPPSEDPIIDPIIPEIIDPDDGTKNLEFSFYYNISSIINCDVHGSSYFLIDSYEDFVVISEKYSYLKVFSIYGEDFFNKYNLIYYFSFQSHGLNYQVNSLVLDQGKLTVDIETRGPEIVTLQYIPTIAHIRIHFEKTEIINNVQINVKHLPPIEYFDLKDEKQQNMLLERLDKKYVGIKVRIDYDLNLWEDLGFDNRDDFYNQKISELELVFLGNVTRYYYYIFIEYETISLEEIDKFIEFLKTNEVKNLTIQVINYEI